MNLAEEDQVEILAQLTCQDRLYLAYQGDELNHRFTKIIQHDDQQRQQLDELVRKEVDHWAEIPAEYRDFDHAKAEFMRWFE